MSTLSRWIFIGVTFASVASFANTNFGVFMVVKGDVKVERADQSKLAAKVGIKVFPGDTIQTAAESRAKITMSDRNNIHISPSSVFKIVAYEQDETKKNVELHLNEGKVRNEVKNSYDGTKSKYIIKTPSAVAGVRGTDFMVNFDAKTKLTQVITFKGSVAFTALSDQLQEVGETVIVNKQQSSTVQQNAPPEPPKSLPETEFKQMENDTKANTPPASVGDAKTESKSPQETRPQERREPLKDVGDKSPDAFEKMPDANEMNKRPPQPPQQIMPPRPNTRVNDAIRNKTDKTKVIIRPKKPNADTNGAPGIGR